MNAESYAAPVNVRDVADGLPRGTMRSHLLLRGDAPYTGDGAPGGVPWPPRVVIDLRHPGEAGDQHPLATVAQVHQIPVLSAASPVLSLDLHSMPDLAETYLEMLRGDAGAALIRAVETIGDADAAPVLVHCAIGKDRTGVVIALVLRLLGIQRAEVTAEYVRTDQAVSALIHRPALKKGRWRNQLRGPNGDIHPAVRANPQALEAVMNVWDSHPDGVEGWYLQRGGKPKYLRAIQDRLISSH